MRKTRLGLRAAKVSSPLSGPMKLHPAASTITSARGPPTGTWELAMEWNDHRFTVVAGRTYSDVAPGGLVLYPGSSGQIELAVRDGSAAEETGARRGTRFRLRRTG